MSMICRLLELSPAQMGALLAIPSLASDLARVTEADGMRAVPNWDRLPPERRAAAEARYRDWKAKLDTAHARLAPLEPFEHALNLEKSWHILHYLFTGRVDGFQGPGGTLLTGTELGDDLGYGPARLQNEHATADFARFLQSVDPSRLHIKMSDMARAGVYGLPMGPGTDEAEIQSEVSIYFAKLRDYVAATAAKHDGLLIWLS